MYEVRIVQINLVHLSQATDTSCIVTQLGYQTRLFQIQTIVRYTVPADIEHSGQCTDVRFEGNAPGNDRQQALELTCSGNVHTRILGNVRLDTQVDHLHEPGIEIIVRERIIPLPEILRKVFERMETGRDIHLQRKYVLERQYREVKAMEQVEVFPERKPLHVVHHRPTAQVGNSLMDVQHGRTGEDHLQFGVIVVHQLQFLRPVLVAMYLINEQVFASISDKRIGQIEQPVLRKIEIFCRNVE